MEGSTVELVAAGFGLGDVCGPPVYVARGELGHVWRVATSRGSWAVKQLVAPVDEMAGHDLPFQLALLDAGGVPMPRPVPTGAGSPVLVGPGGQAFRVYTWVDHVPSARIEPRRAGELLAGIHSVGYPATSVHPWYYDPPDPADLGGFDGLLATLAVVDGRPPPAERLIGCHLDFSPQNVLVDAAGDPWVVDWENSGGGDPDEELAQVVLAFGGTDVLAGYEAAGGPGRLRGLESFRMTFVVQANFVALCLRRGSPIHGPLVTLDDAERVLASLL